MSAELRSFSHFIFILHTYLDFFVKLVRMVGCDGLLK